MKKGKNISNEENSQKKFFDRVCCMAEIDKVSEQRKNACVCLIEAQTKGKQEKDLILLCVYVAC